MSSKAAEDRIQGALNAIGPLMNNVVEVYVPIKNYLDQWATVNNRELVSAKLSLGGFNISASQKDLRNAKRALMMAYLFNGKAAFKDRVERLTEGQIKQQFISEFAIERAAAPLGARLGHTFNIFATPLEKETCKLACAETPPVLDRVIAGLGRVAGTPGEKTKFERWFGAYTPEKLNTITTNFKRIRNTPKGIHLHYWGTNATGDNGGLAYEYLMNKANNRVPIGRESRVAFIDDNNKHYLKSDPDFHHIFICDLFFGDKVRPTGLAGSHISRACAIIHELTHNLLGTHDKWYGTTACKAKATENHPDALTCASNYQWYAEEFNG